MKSWLLLLLISACSVTASAQDLPDFSAPCAPSITENRRAVLEYEGQSGIWFRHEVALCLLQRLNALPLFASRVRLLEQRLSITSDRDELRREQIGLAEQEAEQAQVVLEQAVRGRRQAEGRLHVWYRSPAFLIGTGVVITAALEALAIWALHRSL